MKTIFLLRHGKSDWGADYDSDHERPLKGRGVRAARRMGRLLTATGDEPDIIVSSSAVRALTTAQLAHEAGGWTCELQINPALYGAHPERLADIARSIDEGHDSLLMTGHEPTFSSATGAMIGSADVRFPTAALACIDFHVPRWDGVGMGRGTLRWFVTPKLLSAAGFDAG